MGVTLVTATTKLDKASTANIKYYKNNIVYDIKLIEDPFETNVVSFWPESVLQHDNNNNTY